mmetsp:Transcript_5871/g.12029  ORF Transcript_5871/g.12029 Transcript_5871/m.12029 type:complete len:101 (-) Transcript_5871:282-584(-)
MRHSKLLGKYFEVTNLACICEDLRISYLRAARQLRQELQPLAIRSGSQQSSSHHDEIIDVLLLLLAVMTVVIVGLRFLQLTSLPQKMHRKKLEPWPSLRT